MGTDIHAVIVESKHNDVLWIHDFQETSRNYKLFAALAGVRNGFGFAGVRTHTPLEPISEPRGLPEDVPLVNGDEVPLGLYVPGHRPHASEEESAWLGDHSYSWVTLREILDYDWDRPVSRTGVISHEQYMAWNGSSSPSSWCGGISGAGIKVNTPETADEETTHYQVVWYERVRDGLEVFMKYVDYLAERFDPDSTRIVFGFDS